MSGFECIMIVCTATAIWRTYVDDLCFYLEEVISTINEHVCARLRPTFHLRLRATRRASQEQMNMQNYFYVHVCCLYSNLYWVFLPINAAVPCNKHAGTLRQSWLSLFLIEKLRVSSINSLPPTGVYYITASKNSHFYIVFIPHLSNYQLQCISIECHLPIRSLFANLCRLWSYYSTLWLQYAPNTKFDYILPPNSILVSMISFKLTCCTAGSLHKFGVALVQRFVESKVTYI